MSLSYDGFKTRLTTEVPHLEKMGSFLRLIILEDNEEVDLSSSYFNFLMIVRGLYHDKGLRICFSWLAHCKYSSSLHQQNLKFDFVYNITSSVWRNGLSVLKTTAFLVYPPHFSKFNCNPAPLNLETVNFQQSNVLCEACCLTHLFYGQTESRCKI